MKLLRNEVRLRRVIDAEIADGRTFAEDHAIYKAKKAIDEVANSR